MKATSKMALIVVASWGIVSSMLLPPPSKISVLWGQYGENWSPTSRLPDFSFAGYHAGERAIPRVAVWRNVRDFGAQGDGRTDDTLAIQQAVDSFPGSEPGALLFPAGRYKLSARILIEKPYLVLRGEGERKTFLLGSKGLGPDYEGRFYLEFHGRNRGRRLTGVARPAKRGDTKLVVRDAKEIRAGDYISFKMYNPNRESASAFNTLGCYLYGNQGCPNAERVKWFSSFSPYVGYSHVIDWYVRVKVVSGTTLTLVRPLRWDVRPEWRPEIYSFDPSVFEVGIEDLTMQFSEDEYRGHHREAGFNGVYFRSVYFSWVHRVTFIDTDWALKVGHENPIYDRSAYNSFHNLTFRAKFRTRMKGGGLGHYGIQLGGNDNLVHDCVLETRYIHNLSLGAFASGNVYSRIRMQNGRLDHHGAAPHENLFTEIDITQAAGDLFTSGGRRVDEPSAGVRSTFWNIRSPAPFPTSIPKYAWAAAGRKRSAFPLINIIGVDMLETSTPDSHGHWVERWEGEKTFPPNLYLAQLERRLADQREP